MSAGSGKTSTGIEQNTAGLLCYLGWWITGIIFYVLEKENKFVRFHAVQSIIVFGLISIVLIVLGPIFGFVFFLRWILWVIWVIGFILWIILMVKANQGQMYKLPWAGNQAEKYSQTTAAPPPTQQPPDPPKEDKKE